MSGKYKCEYCSTEFSTKSNLNRHKYISKKCTQSEKRYIKCEYCFKELTTISILNYHKQICKEKKKKINNSLLLEKEIQTIKQDLQKLKDTAEKIEKNKKIEELEEEKIEIVTDIKEYKFGTTDFIVQIRSDGMINATSLCKAGEKRLDHYKESPQTKAFLEELSLVTGIRVSNLFEANIGGHNGTWVHRKIGYHLAQWISPKFAAQVSTILDELFIIGKVDLNKNIPKDEIEIQYKEKINSLNEEYKTLLHKHNSSLKTHRYIKFKKSDPCFYIIDSGIYNEPKNYYKFGISGTDEKHTIDDRLKNHRTLWPLLKVRFLLFIKDVQYIEKSFKIMYDNEINPNGHEIIEGVTLENMTDRLKKLLNLLGIKEYEIMIEEKLKEYNDYVDTTLKIK